MCEDSEKRTYRERFVSAASGVVWVAVAAAIYAGPPVYVAYRALQGGPLIASETVTRTTTETVYHGILPDVATVVLLWLVALLILKSLTIAPARF